VSGDELYAFYDARLPAGIHDKAAFERWRKQAEREDPRCLYFAREELLAQEETVNAREFPAHLELQGLRLPVRYRFEPGEEDDGMTVMVPLAALNQLRPEPFEWLVPGLLEEKLTLLIKSLPKQQRRHFVPVPEYARACREALRVGAAPLLEALAERLTTTSGVPLEANSFRSEQLPSHLFTRFEVVDPRGKALAAGRDLAALQLQCGSKARASFQALPDSRWERTGLKQWDFGDLPEFVRLDQAGVQVRGYPALVAGEEGIDLRLLDTPREAACRHHAGVLALLRRHCARTVKEVQRHLPGIDALCLRYAPLGGCAQLKEDILQAVLQQAFLVEGEAPRTQEAFLACARQGEGRLVTIANEVCNWLAPALEEYHLVSRMLKGTLQPAWLETAAELRAQLDELVHPGFVAATPYGWLPQLARFLKAMRMRWEKLPRNPGRDRQLAQPLAPLVERYRQAYAALAKFESPPAALEEYRWLVEELRVSLFAQELKTSAKVSPERLEKAWDVVQASSRLSG
jgi:ATP-dependent helicase HrpA